MNRNPHKFADQIEQAIKDRQCGISKKFHIGIVTERIVCWPASEKLGKPPIILGAFTEADLEKGLTCKQWGELFVKIGTWLQEK